MTPDDPRIPPDRPDLDAASGRATPAPGSRGAGRAAEPGGTGPASGDGPHTHDRPPLDADLDEQASAALDDATDGARGSRPPGPAVAARAADMAAGREALRSVPPADPARRDRAIAAALAAFDEAAVPDGGAAHTSTTGVPPRDELAARRGAGRRPSPTARRLVAAAAAAVVVIAVGVAVIGSDQDDSTTASDSMATTEAGADREQADAGSGASTDDAGDAQEAPDTGDSDSDAAVAPEAATDAPLLALGEHASIGALLDAAEQADGTLAPPVRDDADAATARLSARCPTGVPGPIAEAGDAARPVAMGTADGAPIEVWRGGPDDAPVLVALDSGCQVVSTRPVG